MNPCYLYSSIIAHNTHLRAEPGYYADGRFGIRLENVAIVKKASTPNDFGDRGYLGFEHITMVRNIRLPPRVDRSSFVLVRQCPMSKKLIDAELLAVAERAWLDSYHAEVLEKLSPLIQHDERALEWLKRECSPL